MSKAAMQSGDMKAFMVIDDRLAVLIIAADYAITIAIVLLAIIAHHPLVTILAIPLIAGRQVAFLNLVHAAGHHSLFSKRDTNYSVDLFVGYLIFDAVRPYRSYHLQHHREFTRKEQDRFDYLEERLPGHHDGPWRRTWEVIIKPVFGFATFDFVRAVVVQAQGNPWWAWRLAAYWIVVVSAFWWAGWLGYLLLYWFLPLVWLYPVFYSWAELSDHYAVKEDARNQRGLFYLLFIKGHEMYHAVHHRYPRIPFYRIRAASRYLSSIGENLEETRGVVDFVKILYRRPPDRAEADSSI
ncbi:MAG: fatty acid desaturase [Pyrinomonadaceae bacterium]